MTKEEVKNEKAKREKVEKLYKCIKHDLAKALKERDENRVIQERVDENREGGIVQLTELIEKALHNSARDCLLSENKSYCA